MKKNKFECTTATIHTAKVDNFVFELKWNLLMSELKSLKIGTKQKSPTFNADYYNSSWHIGFGVLSDHPPDYYYALYLCLEKANEDIEFSFAYVVKTGEKVIEKGGCTGRNRQGRTNEVIYYYERVNKNDFKKSLDWNKPYLTIILQVTAVVKEKYLFSEKLNPVELPMSFESPCKQYLTLIDTGLYSDVTLVVNKREFKAHKAILASRCDYFESMFRQNFKESIESRVEIEDVDSNDFKTILEYIYGGKLPNYLNENGAELLIAADRFGLKELVDECENLLKKMITSENYLRLYQLADLTSRPALEAEIITFVNSNYKSLKETQAWKDFKMENPHLFGNLIEKILDVVKMN